MIGYTLSLRSISTENQRISPQDEIPKERGTHIVTLDHVCIVQGGGSNYNINYTVHYP